MSAGRWRTRTGATTELLGPGRNRRPGPFFCPSARATSERFAAPPQAGKMIPCNGIHILPARSEPVAEATRARAGERRLSRRRGDATHGERRTTALGDPTREAPPGDHGGAMATSGSHRAQPFAGRGRCERRRTKRDPGERCQGAAARATPCVAGVPPISGTHRPQGRLPRLGPLGLRVGKESAVTSPRFTTET